MNFKSILPYAPKIKDFFFHASENGSFFFSLVYKSNQIIKKRIKLIVEKINAIVFYIYKKKHYNPELKE
jgi:hypothetical protein